METFGATYKRYSDTYKQAFPWPLAHHVKATLSREPLLSHVRCVYFSTTWHNNNYHSGGVFTHGVFTHGKQARGKNLRYAQRVRKFPE